MQTGKKYEPKFTPLSQKAAAMAIEEAVIAITGKALGKASLCILLAQSALETGGYEKIPNFNFGGLKASTSSDYAEWPTKEGYGKTEERIVAKFRAYPDAVSGAKDFVRLLANSPRYAKAWTQVEAGDPIQYAIELGRAGYYTADPMMYAKGVARRWAECALRMTNYGVTPDEVRRFQKDHNIGVDGLIGPVTRNALRQALGG